jgi:hypothetical protein
MKRIIKTIELLQTTNNSPEEISFIAGNITPYTVRRIRIMLGWKKCSNKKVGMMTKGNLKEFYSVLESEMQSFDKLRELFKLLITTNYSDEKISELSVYKINHVQRFREITSGGQLDWKVMTEINDSQLLDYIHKDNPLHIPRAPHKKAIVKTNILKNAHMIQ